LGRFWVTFGNYQKLQQAKKKKRKKEKKTDKKIDDSKRKQ